MSQKMRQRKDRSIKKAIVIIIQTKILFGKKDNWLIQVESNINEVQLVVNPDNEKIDRFGVFSLPIYLFRLIMGNELIHCIIY